MIKPDTDDMLAVHAVLRDTFGQADAPFTAADDGDVARLEVLRNDYENVLAFLRTHHDS